jgi:hypothetical protein
MFAARAWFRLLSHDAAAINAAMCFVLALFCSPYLFFSANIRVALSGRSAWATVVAKEPVGRRAVYEFSDEAGVVVRGRTGGYRMNSEWEALSVGRKLEVQYLPADPTRHFVGDRAGPFFPYLLFAGAQVLCLGFAVRFAVRGVRRVARQRSLLRTGDRRVAVIRRVTEEQGKRGRLWLTTIEFRFPDPLMSPDSDGYLAYWEVAGRNRRRWAPGDRLTVAVNPRDPADHVLDVFGLIRDSVTNTPTTSETRTG